MYDWAVLLALVALAASGIAYGSVPDNTRVDLVVTTHNPGCTAIFLLDYNVTRQTELRPTHLYSLDEMRNGLNMTFGTYADEAARLVPLLADRGEISSVASYSAGPMPTLLARDTNPDRNTGPFGTTRCDVLYEPLLGAAVDALLADSEGASRSAGASDSLLSPNLVPIRLDTYKLAETLAYLKENGAVMQLARESREGDGWGSISAHVPYTLLVPLYGMDHITYMRELVVEAATTDNYGSIDTKGKMGTNIDAWHDAGYNGTGIRVGVIDLGFMGFDETDELPSDTSFYCFRYNDQTDLYDLSDTDASFCYGDTARGTVAAKTLLDMEPSADLYISRVHTSEQLYRAADWMHGNNVDVIGMSIMMLFDGPNGGGFSNMQSPILDIVDYIMSKEIIWVSSAGNLMDGVSWSVSNPKIYSKLVVFDPATNDTANRLVAHTNEPVSVLLWWDDMDNSNTDLNLYVSNGTDHHVSVMDQWGGGVALPIESVAFVPSSDDQYSISIAVIGTAVPDWIRLIVGPGAHLEHHAMKDLTPSGDLDYTPVSLDITTNNPGCTTVFLSGYNLTRQTDLQYNYEYRIDELRNGINMTFRTHADEAHKVVPLLMERPAVFSVTIYSAGASPGLLAQYTNNSTYTDPVFGRAPCEIRETLLDDAVSSLRAADSGLATASDSAPSRSMVTGVIHTTNLAETLEYLKDNGGIVGNVSEGRDGVGGLIEARMPVSLLIPLSKTDHVIMIQDLQSRMLRPDND